MSAFEIQPPYASFFTRDGRPLEAGYVWVGVVNQDPQANPVAVYFDPELTILAAQPLRTVGGYVVRSGTPTAIYTAGDYSIRVIDRDGTVVYNAQAVKPADASAATEATEAAEEAQAAAEEATDALKDFESLYLGPHVVDPLVDNQGSPLRLGAIYYNTVSQVLKYWTGSAWTSTPSGGTGGGGSSGTGVIGSTRTGDVIFTTRDEPPPAEWPASWAVSGPDEVVNTVPQQYAVDFAQGDGPIVGACGEGKIIRSADGGMTWAVIDTGIGAVPLRTVAFGAGRFVAAGQSGQIVHSATGEAWTSVEIFEEPYNAQFSSVIFANGLFVLAGTYGIATSPDGFTWTKLQVPNLSTATLAAFGAGRFVVTANDSTFLPPTQKFWTSTDGAAWTAQTFPGGLTIAGGLAFGSGRFVAVGASTAFTSQDGLTWTNVTGSVPSTDYNTVEFGNNTFILSGGETSYVTSYDAVTWVAQPIVAGTQLNRVHAVSQKLITKDAPVSAGQTIRLRIAEYSSPYLPAEGLAYPRASYPALAAVLGTRPGIDTATAWTAYSTAIGDVNSCAYGLGLYVAVTASRITTSPDLQNWTTRVSGVAPVAVAFGYQNGGSTGIFVAAGGGVGTLRYSLDGIAWTTLTGIGPTAFVDVIYAAGVFVAVGVARIFTSVDGVTWTERSIPAGVSFSPQKVGYGLGKFVAVGGITQTGSAKQILVSDDAVTWGVQAVPQIGIVTSSVGIAFSGDTAVMTYGAHHALYSKDLVTWRKCHANFQGHDVSGESRVAFGHGLFLYTSRDTAFGYAAYSYDGVTWQDTTMTLESTVVNRVDFVNGKFIACAQSGWVFESGLGYDPATHFAVPYVEPGTGGLRTYIRT